MTAEDSPSAPRDRARLRLAVLIVQATGILLAHMLDYMQEFELGRDEHSPKQVLRVPLLSFGHIESHACRSRKQFGVDHTIIVSRRVHLADQRQFLPELVC